MHQVTGLDCESEGVMGGGKLTVAWIVARIGQILLGTWLIPIYPDFKIYGRRECCVIKRTIDRLKSICARYMGWDLGPYGGT
jgi:hypothetical protein